MKEKVLTLLKSANYNDILLAFELMRSRMSVAEIYDFFGTTNVPTKAKGPTVFIRIDTRRCIAHSLGVTWISLLPWEKRNEYATNLGNHPEYDTRENKDIAEI